MLARVLASLASQERSSAAASHNAARTVKQSEHMEPTIIPYVIWFSEEASAKRFFREPDVVLYQFTPLTIYIMLRFLGSNKVTRTRITPLHIWFSKELSIKRF